MRKMWSESILQSTQVWQIISIYFTVVVSSFDNESNREATSSLILSVTKDVQHNFSIIKSKVFNI